jgi:hypothetical protein
MFFSSFLIALAITWLVAVVDTVVETARAGATSIVMFGRVLFDGVPQETGIYVCCILSASATLAVVTAVAMARGRRLRRRSAEELRVRIDELKQGQAGVAGLATLLPSRVAELQTSVDTLTIRRNELLDELKEIERRRAHRESREVVEVPDAEPVVEVPGAEPVVEVPGAPASSNGKTGASTEPEAAGTA